MKNLFRKGISVFQFKKVLVVLFAVLSIISLASFSIRSIRKDKPVPLAQNVQPITLTWGHQASGDCEMADGSTITFYPNGTGVFHAVVWTNHTHSGDTWHHSIAVKDANGTVLFNLAWDGPGHMNDDGSRYNFDRNFTFDPQFFYIINTATALGNC